MINHTLPNEILLEIFKSGYFIEFMNTPQLSSVDCSYYRPMRRTPKPFIRPLIHVCRRWLDLIKDMPTLWEARIVIADYAGSRGLHYRELHAIQKILKETSECDLDIVMSLSDLDDSESDTYDGLSFIESLAHFRVFLDNLFIYTHRWRQIVCCGVWPQAFHDLLFHRLNETKVLPRLLEFTHYLEPVSVSESLVPPLFLAPKLSKLASSSSDWWCNGDFHLKYLRIEAARSDMGWYPLVTGNSVAGSLQELLIVISGPVRIFSDVDRSYCPLDHLHFPCLTKLVLKFFGPFNMFRFFSALRAPHLHSLEIRDSSFGATHMSFQDSTPYHCNMALRSLILQLLGDRNDAPSQEAILSLCRMFASPLLHTMELSVPDFGEAVSVNRRIELPGLEKLVIHICTTDLAQALSSFHLPKLLNFEPSVTFYGDSKLQVTSNFGPVVLPNVRVIRFGVQTDLLGCSLLQAPQLNTFDASKIINPWQLEETLKDSLRNVTTLEINKSGLANLHWFQQVDTLKFHLRESEFSCITELCRLLLGTSHQNTIDLMTVNFPGSEQRHMQKSSAALDINTILPRLSELCISSWLNPGITAFPAEVITILQDVVIQRISIGRPLQVLSISTTHLLPGEIRWFQSRVPSLLPHVSTWT